MNGHGELIARHEAMLANDRRPRFILRAIPNNPNLIHVAKSRDEARWIADRMVQLDTFAPGLKNFDLIPDLERGDFYYFFMGEAESPISFAKILSNGIFIYGAPAYTPIGFDVYPEMILAYITDFLSAFSDLYRHLNYHDPFQIQIELRNVEGVVAKISQPGEWRPIPPNILRIRENIILTDTFASADAINIIRVRQLLNGFFTRIGLPGRTGDAPLPRSFENQLAALR